MTKTTLSKLTTTELRRFTKQTAKRIIKNGKGDGRKRIIADYDHRMVLLKFGYKLPKKEQELRLEWFCLVDQKIRELTSMKKKKT